MNITKKQQQVLAAIRNNPQAADDDAMLLAEVWSVELADLGYEMAPDRLYNMLKRVSRAESITRRRRELFNAGFIYYTQDASKRRMTAFLNEADAHGTFTRSLHDQ